MAGAARVAVRKYTIPQNMTVEYMLGDHLGSTSITTDSNGTQISEMRYKPWGETRYEWTNAPANTSPVYELTRYQYTGQYSYDVEFGLKYYNARWLDSTTGRFTQPDNIIPGAANPQAWDRFAYTLNNPIKFSDPSGHFSEEQLKEWYGEDWLVYINANFSKEMVALLLLADFGDMVAYENGDSIYGAVFALNSDGNLVMWDIASRSQTTLQAIDSHSIVGLYRMKSDRGDYEVEKNFLKGSSLPSTLKLPVGWNVGSKQQVNVNANVVFAPTWDTWAGLTLTGVAFLIPVAREYTIAAYVVGSSSLVVSVVGAFEFNGYSVAIGPITDIYQFHNPLPPGAPTGNYSPVPYGTPAPSAPLIP
ncbi:MAG: hypothetical protein PGMFKBFP_02843 [Anaerolineales bacterium]|nr:hypothetical protein [Anaerolineales bacterium]